ncbi:hypothetical protein STRDD11_01543 [Streptococcus sp. DD11]|uniref:hypothetical protein n=1 Tax=Streptococcus sp. DD11 TaxID=1777879 RepID=UPI0007990384|nr:hypothetical protein [Streptococcus sp. DD11]KXT83346.1 hypothetical protein STRDD11_01543 [Streptococcus sp. DD11]
MGQHSEDKIDQLYNLLRRTQESYNNFYDDYMVEKRAFEEVMTETDDLYHSARQQIEGIEDYTVACVKQSVDDSQIIHEFYDKVFQVQDDLETDYRKERDSLNQEYELFEKNFHKKTDKYEEELAKIRRSIHEAE